MANLNTSYKAGDMVELGVGCEWHGFYRIIEVVRVFENGKVAVAVEFKHRKRKIFHLPASTEANTAPVLPSNTVEYLRDLATRVDDFDKISINLLADQLSQFRQATA